MLTRTTNERNHIMTDPTTKAKESSMTDPMTPERLTEIKARYPGAGSYTEEQVAAMGWRALDDMPALLAEVQRLQAAVERVRELHQDAGQSQGYFPDDHDYGERDHCCGTCGSHGEYGVEWPCPTIAALDGDEQ